ncbi:Protein of unknown function [Gryllus bimaculatus]|nr:Protein of unknown function [Gryllus bimaculatus]
MPTAVPEDGVRWDGGDGGGDERCSSAGSGAAGKTVQLPATAARRRRGDALSLERRCPELSPRAMGRAAAARQLPTRRDGDDDDVGLLSLLYCDVCFGQQLFLLILLEAPKKPALARARRTGNNSNNKVRASDARALRCTPPGVSNSLHATSPGAALRVGNCGWRLMFFRSCNIDLVELRTTTRLLLAYFYRSAFRFPLPQPRPSSALNPRICFSCCPHAQARCIFALTTTIVSTTITTTITTTTTTNNTNTNNNTVINTTTTTTTTANTTIPSSPLSLLPIPQRAIGKELRRLTVAVKKTPGGLCGERAESGVGRQKQGAGQAQGAGPARGGAGRARGGAGRRGAARGRRTTELTGFTLSSKFDLENKREVLGFRDIIIMYVKSTKRAICEPQCSGTASWPEGMWFRFPDWEGAARAGLRVCSGGRCRTGRPGASARREP